MLSVGQLKLAESRTYWLVTRVCRMAAVLLRME